MLRPPRGPGGRRARRPAGRARRAVAARRRLRRCADAARTSSTRFGIDPAALATRRPLVRACSRLDRAPPARRGRARAALLDALLRQTALAAPPRRARAERHARLPGRRPSQRRRLGGPDPRSAQSMRGWPGFLSSRDGSRATPQRRRPPTPAGQCRPSDRYGLTACGRRRRSGCGRRVDHAHRRPARQADYARAPARDPTASRPAARTRHDAVGRAQARDLARARPPGARPSPRCARTGRRERARPTPRDRREQRAAAGRVGEVRAVEAQPRPRSSLTGPRNTVAPDAASSTVTRTPASRRFEPTIRHAPARGRDRLHPHLARERAHARSARGRPQQHVGAVPDRRPSPRRRRPARSPGSSPGRRTSPSEIWCSSMPERRSKTISAPSVERHADVARGGDEARVALRRQRRPRRRAGRRRAATRRLLREHALRVTESGGHRGRTAPRPRRRPAAGRRRRHPRRTAAPARSASRSRAAGPRPAPAEAASHMASRRGTATSPNGTAGPPATGRGRSARSRPSAVPRAPDRRPGPARDRPETARSCASAGAVSSDHSAATTHAIRIIRAGCSGRDADAREASSPCYIRLPLQSENRAAATPVLHMESRET